MAIYLFLTNQYLPKPGATGMCMHQLAKKIASSNEQVATICYEDGDKQDTFDGVKTIKIKIPDFLKKYDTNSLFVKKINYIKSIIRKLIYIFKYPLRSQSLVKNYMKAARRFIKNDDKVIIIASYTPLEAVLAAYKLKRKFPNKVKIVYYSADTLSNEQGEDGILPLSYRIKCGVKWEKKLFKVFDKILIMECHKNHYYCKEYEEFKNKMFLTNFPLLINSSINNNNLNNPKIKLLYAGTFYRKLRNPEFLCRCILSLDDNVQCDIFGGGDCDDIIQSFVKQSNDKIIFHGMVTHEEVKENMASSNVLLSIGNNESPMVPSKIYEYMSTGKPIIHFYFYDGDSCIKPLKEYGNSLLIKDGDIHAIDRIKEFLSNIEYLDFDIIKNKFITSTPEYTIDILMK